MSRSLNDLEPDFRARCFELIARCAEVNVPVMIVNTRRTAAEQAAYVAQGVSWVAHSKHEDGLAIDICPYHSWMAFGERKLDWNVDNPVWLVLGHVGETLGLVWGGRWKKRDMGHFEAREP